MVTRAAASSELNKWLLKTFWLSKVKANIIYF